MTLLQRMDDVFAIAAALIFVGATGGLADGHQDNSNIVRMVSGTHSFYEEDGTTLRGQEFFRMIVHPDGHRTMNIVKNMFSGHRQHTIVMRVDPAYRPVDVFASYRYPEGFKGSVRITLDGDLLSATSSVRWDARNTKCGCHKPLPSSPMGKV